MIAVNTRSQASNRPRTPMRAIGSRFLCAVLLSAACGQSQADTKPAPDPKPAPVHGISRDPEAKPEVCLGVHDSGIWSDLDDKIQLALPKSLEAARVSARIDRDKQLLIVSIDSFPR